MRLLTTSIASLFLATCLVVVSAQDSNAQKVKLKDKIANAAAGGGGGGGAAGGGASNAKLAEPYAKDFDDPTGTSGSYTCLIGSEIQGAVGKRLVKNYKIDFKEKEGDKFVNQADIYFTKDGQKVTFMLNDKMTKKMGVRVFRTTDYHSIWMVEVEKGIFLDVHHSSTHQEGLDGSEKVEDVIAKDASVLEAWDKDIAQAKFDALFRKSAAADMQKTKQKLMDDYKAYKENVGKVVFVDNFRVFNGQYGDKPTEDPAKFLKSHSMGKALYLGAYLDMPMTLTCGKDCQMNFVYEMNGKTADRVALRNQDAKWNKMVKDRPAKDYFCINNGFSLWSPSENVMDYAYLKVLYENKDTFKKGQTYKLNVTMYSNRDGNNVEKVAEGSINLIWDDEAIKVMEGKLFKDFRDFLDE